MNDQLQQFARSQLKEGLAKLPDNCHLFFKRMYSHDNLDADINDVVDTMQAASLDNAMQQVQRTLDKRQ